MAQRSVVTQTTRPLVEQKYSYRWMRHFFTEDVSPDNCPIVELQRRAVWIGLALILQALNEIDHDWYIPYLMPFGSLIPFALILGSFLAMWMAFRPASVRQQAQYAQKHPSRWQRTILILTVMLVIPGGILFGRAAVLSFPHTCALCALRQL
jgi:hypothetical protein